MNDLHTEMPNFVLGNLVVTPENNIGILTRIYDYDTGETATLEDAAISLLAATVLLAIPDRTASDPTESECFLHDLRLHS